MGGIITGTNGCGDLDVQAGDVDGGGVDEVAGGSEATALWRHGKVDAEAVEHTIKRLRSPRQVVNDLYCGICSGYDSRVHIDLFKSECNWRAEESERDNCEQ